MREDPSTLFGTVATDGAVGQRKLTCILAENCAAICVCTIATDSTIRQICRSPAEDVYPAAVKVMTTCDRQAGQVGGRSRGTIENVSSIATADRHTR